MSYFRLSDYTTIIVMHLNTYLSGMYQIRIEYQLMLNWRKKWIDLENLWNSDAMLIMLHYQMIITTKTSQLSSRWAKNNKHLHSIVQCDQNFLSFSTHVSWQLLFSCLIPNRWNFFFLMWSMPYTCGLGLICLSLLFCRHSTYLTFMLVFWLKTLAMHFCI